MKIKYYLKIFWKLKNNYLHLCYEKNKTILVDINNDNINCLFE